MSVSGLTKKDLGLPVDEKIRQVYPDEGTIISLSEREMTVLRKMASFETLREVADDLSVSVNTVKKQSAAIYQKLGVHNRKDALAEARRQQIIA